MDGDEITRRLYERLHAVMSRDGWRMDLASSESHQWRLVRKQREVRQELSFGAYMEGPGLAHVLKNDGTSGFVEIEPGAQINVYLRFSSDAVDARLRQLLPEDAELLAEAYRSGADAHFFVGPDQVFPEASGLSGEWVADGRELDAWIDRFIAWYERDGRAALDACNDPASLNRTLHTPRTLQRKGFITGLQHMLSTLVLVDLCKDPAVPQADWFDAVSRAQEESYRWECERYSQYPGDYERVPQRVRENEAVERLFVRLCGRRPPVTGGD